MAGGFHAHADHRQPGSGKSWLAERLARRLQVKWVDLDVIHWLSDENSIARPRSEALAMARIAANDKRWVIEGVYGWMISELIHRATALIWLCVDDDACIANIRQREQRAEADELLLALLEWAGSYRLRDGPSSFAAHQRLFDGFGGAKTKLSNRGEITAWMNVPVPKQ